MTEKVSRAKLSPHGRLYDIDRAKGLAIILVVLGHISENAIPGNDWYLYTRKLIYTFHMGFFMYLSGYVMGLSYRPWSTFREYISYIQKPAMRLATAYCIFVLVILIIKLLTQEYVIVNNPITSISDISLVFMKPTSSYARYLWYIYVLTEFYLCYPLLMRVFNNRLELLFLLTLFISQISSYFTIKDLFGIYSFIQYLPFLLLGCIAVKYQTRWLQSLSKYGGMFLFAFVIVLALQSNLGIPKIIVGLASIPALHYFVRQPFVSNSTLLFKLGIYSLPIYFMNTLAMGAVIALIFIFTSWDDWRFIFFSPVLIAAGLFLPIAVRDMLIARYPKIDNVLGLGEKVRKHAFYQLNDDRQIERN